MQLNTLAMVHTFLKEHVRPGALCIDATAGRGRDTALLCRLAGNEGRVLAFDIQQEAVKQTKALLEQEGLSAQVYLESHANLSAYARPGTVDCIVFNFGRLPGGDPRIVTKAASSLAAIRAGLELLKPGGVIAIALYYGGENGYEEKEAVLEFLKTVDDRQYSVLVCDWANRRGEPPMPIFLWKEH